MKISMKINAKELPVMKSHCKTCPFKEIDGREANPQLAADVTARTLFKAHQICHGTEGPNREPRNRCKGSYDHNKMIYERMGLDVSLLK